VKNILLYTLLVNLSLPLAGFSADLSKKGNSAVGAKVWSDNCGRCHNIRDARELRDDQWKTTVFHMRVRAGLTGQETRDVIAFLTSTNNPPRRNIFSGSSSTSSSKTKLSGKQVYNQTCIACHGENGKGTLPGVPDFTRNKGPLAKNDKTLIKNITDGYQGPGSPMAMPAKGGKADLSDNEIRAVLVYIRREFGK